jgi:hypothetical protein
LSGSSSSSNIAATAATSEILILAMVQYLWYRSAINTTIITGLGWLRWCFRQIGRTISSFRIALAIEKEDWRPFRNASDKSIKKFDEG